ncbi:hypothetical protein H311_00689, partial [Anncaliia algerae PRA109]
IFNFIFNYKFCTLMHLEEQLDELLNMNIIQMFNILIQDGLFRIR